jgi:hypothetical protein
MKQHSLRYYFLAKHHRRMHLLMALAGWAGIIAGLSVLALVAVAARNC